MKNNSRQIALILLLLFMLPSFVAFLVYQYPDRFRMGQINKGHLLSPVMQSDAIQPLDKWHLFLVQTGSCGSQCIRTLDKLHRVRMSLGKDLYRTKQSIVLQVSEQSNSLEERLKQVDSSEIVVDAKSLAQFKIDKPQIFIADPHANIIMSYAANAAPDDIYTDLKRLLKVSKIG